VDALSLTGFAGKTEVVRTVREFKTEAGLTSEKAVTKAEKDLAQKYYEAHGGPAVAVPRQYRVRARNR
jgi:hypothetical protein